MEQKGLSPAVLLYGFGSDARADRIRGCLRQQGIAVIDVPKAAYALPLGALLQIPGFPNTEPEAADGDISEEMLVMHAMQGQRMQRFLQFFRDEGLPPVALKAVATPTNLFWSSLQLFKELRRERAYFEQQKASTPKAAGEGGS